MYKIPGEDKNFAPAKKHSRYHSSLFFAAACFKGGERAQRGESIRSHRRVYACCMPLVIAASPSRWDVFRVWFVVKTFFFFSSGTLSACLWLCVTAHRQRPGKALLLGTRASLPFGRTLSHCFVLRRRNAVPLLVFLWHQVAAKKKCLAKREETLSVDFDSAVCVHSVCSKHLCLLISCAALLL